MNGAGPGSSAPFLYNVKCHCDELLAPENHRDDVSGGAERSSKPRVEAEATKPRSVLIELEIASSG